MNPRACYSLPVFEAGPFSHLGTSPEYGSRTAARPEPYIPILSKTSGYASTSFPGLYIVSKYYIIYCIIELKKAD